MQTNSEDFIKLHWGKLHRGQYLPARFAPMGMSCAWSFCFEGIRRKTILLRFLNTDNGGTLKLLSWKYCIFLLSTTTLNQTYKCTQICFVRTQIFFSRSHANVVQYKQAYLLYWQRLPLKPLGHLHLNVLPNSLQDPRLQGFFSHGLLQQPGKQNNTNF